MIQSCNRLQREPYTSPQFSACCSHWVSSEERVNEKAPLEMEFRQDIKECL